MTEKSEKQTKGWNLDNSYASLPKAFFTSLPTNPVKSPKLIVFNDKLASSLGLNPQAVQQEDGVAELAGNRIPEGASPLAQAYAGHQFGHFNMLGDGRALLLGEQINPEGKRFDIQLKGSGRTPYSRGGDGRAALGPMLREYIISEAMVGLGIPTTRSLAVVTTGESIVRETELPGAILTRIASSHLRVGTFQYAAQLCTREELRELADYTIERHYPDIQSDENPYLSFLREVIKRQAALIAKWQLVGFIHGVMNTDNMTISGETIDYGPCAFMDSYDPATVFSSIDTQGRYAYGNQPYMAGWNLARFAESLLSLLDENQEVAIEMAQNEIAEFNRLYQNHWLKGMRAKLGILDDAEDDLSLIGELLEMMQKSQADYTNTFRALTIDKLEQEKLFETEAFTGWYKVWKQRISTQEEASTREMMRKSNPAIIPRNHLVEEALEAAVKREDYSVMEELLQALSNPYDEQQEIKFCSIPSPSTSPYRTYCGT